MSRKLRVLLLEDDPERISWFARRLQGTDYIIVGGNGGLSAAVAFCAVPPDIMLLDHDLGGRQLEEHEDNGHRFLRGLLEGGAIGPETAVIVHSYNEDGARAMKGEWPAALCLPFLSMSFRSILDMLLGGEPEGGAS